MAQSRDCDRSALGRRGGYWVGLTWSTTHYPKSMRLSTVCVTHILTIGTEKDNFPYLYAAFMRSFMCFFMRFFMRFLWPSWHPYILINFLSHMLGPTFSFLFFPLLARNHLHFRNRTDLEYISSFYLDNIAFNGNLCFGFTPGIKE